MSDNDARGGRRWVLPVVIGAIVLALGGGIGLGIALSGGSGETEEISPTPSTNSGIGGTTKSDGGSGTSTQPTSPQSPAAPKPKFTSTAVTPGSVQCPKDGEEKFIVVSWSTMDATTVDVAGSTGLPPTGESTRAYTCDGRPDVAITLVAHGPGGDTTTTVRFYVVHQ